MENSIPIHLREVIFSSSNRSLSKQISKLEKAGKIKKLHHVFIHQILLMLLKQLSAEIFLQF